MEDACFKMPVHGTTEVWPGPEKEPPEYKKYLSWLKEIKFLELSKKVEKALVTICTPPGIFATPREDKETFGGEAQKANNRNNCKAKMAPPRTFSRRVVEAALAGCLFIKSDENLHLSKKELVRYVSLTREKLEKSGFDLSLKPGKGKRKILISLAILR